jgi:glycerol-3-phosphate dehydrogenase
VSRDYNIVPGTLTPGSETAVLSLVGGKWTTFRALGERLSDAVLERLGAERTVSTTQLAIGGGVGFPTTPEARADWISISRDTLPASRVDVLLSRYGTRAVTVIDAITAGEDSPLETDPSYSTGEVRYLAAHESVVHLRDVVLRRTNHAFTGDISMDLLRELAGLVGPVLKWNDARIAAEVHDAADELLAEHGMRFAGAQGASASA